MNWLDIVIVAVFLWFTLSAFQAGFIRETVTIVGIFLGIVLAGLYYKDLADDVLVFIDNENLANIVAFGIIAGATWLAGQMMALVLKPTIDLIQLGIFDQLAGAIFGFAKAMIFIQVLLIVLITYPRWHVDKTIDGSFFASLIMQNTAFVVNVLPNEFQVGLDTFKANF